MARSDRSQWARLDVDGVDVLADLAAGVHLARPLRFQEPQLCCFGADAPSSSALRFGHFNGRVSDGASCNASVVRFAPHAHLTHTECVAHLTIEPLDAWRVVPQRLLMAVLVSLQPTPAGATEDASVPAPQAGDELLTRTALRDAWPAPPSARLAARAAVIRTLPNEPDRFTGERSGVPPYLSAQAVEELMTRGIAHLVIDLPSLDRIEDGGALTAHRLFFGLPPAGRQLSQAQRPDCTVTELAYVDNGLPDGWYLLSLQTPCIDGDAVASRPVLYPLRLP